MRLTLQDMFSTVYYNVVVNKMTLQNIDNQKQSSYEHLPYGCFIGMCLPEDLAKRLQEESLRIHVYKIYRLLNSSRCADNPVLKEVSDILPINWAQAYALYKAGVTNSLTPEEQIVQLRITEENTEPAVIEDYLKKLFILEKDNKAFHCATTDIMKTLLENGYKAMSPRALQMEIATTLTALGFTKGKYQGLNGWYGVIMKGDNPAVKAALSS